MEANPAHRFVELGATWAEYLPPGATRLSNPPAPQWFPALDIPKSHAMSRLVKFQWHLMCLEGSRFMTWQCQFGQLEAKLD